MQRARIRAVYRDGAPQQHRPGVEALVHEHDADAGFGVPRHDGARDGRRPAPARQQRGVEVEAAAARRGEHGGRQEDAVGDGDDGVESGGQDFAFETRRSPHIEAGGRGGAVHGARAGAPAAPRGPRRPGIDAQNAVAGGADGVERRHGELRRAHERDAQTHAGASPKRSRPGTAAKRRRV